MVFPQWWLAWRYLILVLIIWEVIWKGIALWKSARNGHMVWYIFILIINSLGILPIEYIFGFSKPKAHKAEGTSPKISH